MEQDINGGGRKIYRKGGDMGRIIISAAILAALLLGSILVSGCTGDGGGSQPPASIVTMTTRRPATPVPETMEPPATVTGVTSVPTSTTMATIPEQTPGSIIQDESALLITGDVMGYRSQNGGYIDEIRFTVVKAPRAGEVTLDVTNTQIVFTKDNTQYAVNYLLLSGDLNGDRILDPGETVLVSIPLQPPNVIYTNQRFTMAIKTPPYQPVVVSAKAPPVLTTDPMVLASASS
jgi:hypothetical protein